QVPARSRSSFDARKALSEAPQPFIDALDRRGIGQAEESPSTECLPGHHRDVRFLQQQSGEIRARFWGSVLTIPQVRGNIWERIECASRPFAGDAGNRAQAFDD